MDTTADKFDEFATVFEGKKIGFRHTAKDGYLMTISMNPDDTPEDIMRDNIGQLYKFKVVRINDENEYTHSDDVMQGKKAVQIAGILSEDEDFRSWMCIEGLADGISAEEAAVAVRRYCGVASRAELKTNRDARAKLYGMIDRFKDAMRK